MWFWFQIIQCTTKPALRIVRASAISHHIHKILDKTTRKKLMQPSSRRRDSVLETSSRTLSNYLFSMSLLAKSGIVLKFNRLLMNRRQLLMSTVSQVSESLKYENIKIRFLRYAQTANLKLPNKKDR